MINAFTHYCRTSRVPVTIIFILLFVSSVVLAQSEDAHEQHQNLMRQQGETSANFADITLPDVILVTQDGVEASLANDIVGDKIVVINFVYTTCTTVCPVLSATFSQIQGKLGDRLGDEVVMISLSVDPLRDTPARLKNYASKLGVRDGWVWLTGRRQTVTQVLQELGAYTPNFTDHPSMVLVGDGQSGQWARFIGFPAAAQIIKKVDEFSAARMAHLSHTAMREK
jgi:protein SCO1/2